MTPGQHIGRYRVDGPLGAGGMGSTYRATLLGTDGFERTVVLKLVRSDLRHDPTLRALFLEEVRLLSLLRHPNIATALDAGEVGAEHFIALEYVEGVDLQRLMRYCATSKTPIPHDVASYIAACIARALHYAHGLRGTDGAPLRIIHRDVTPPNILLDVNGEVKLSDFGIAVHEARAKHTQTGQLRGHARYVSPERLVSTGAGIDHRSDIFSLGIVLYEMLAGVHPFFADAAEGAALAIRDGRRAPLKAHRPALAAELLELVESMLNPDRELRPATGAIVEEQLGPYIAPPHTQRALGRLVRQAAHGMDAAAVSFMAPTARADTPASHVTRPRGIVVRPDQAPLIHTDDALELPDAGPIGDFAATAGEPAFTSTEGEGNELAAVTAATPLRSRVTGAPPITSRRNVWPIAGGALGLIAATIAAIVWTTPDAPSPSLAASSEAIPPISSPVREGLSASPAPPATPTAPLAAPVVPGDASDAGANEPRTPASLGTATLELEVLDWGYVWLDGAYRGEARTFRGLQPGTHTIGLTAEPNAHPEKIIKLVLKAGTTRKTYHIASGALRPTADTTH